MNGDLSKPSVHAARELARRKGLAHMRAAGRIVPGPDDGDVFAAEFARLLHHVPASEGGFLGISDEGLETRAARYRIPFYIAAKAVWDAGEWPVADEAMQVAAE